jgi:hypothetical protein
MLFASEKGFQRSIGRRGGCLGTQQVVRAWSVRRGQDWVWHRCIGASVSVSVCGLDVWAAGRNDSLSYCIAGRPLGMPFEPSRADTCRRAAGREGVRCNGAYWSGAEDVRGPP